jgi:8-oxo-dGTP diphosphatase
MIKRFGDSPKPGKTYHRRPGAYALLPRDGALLLTVQNAPMPDIQLPGGGIDAGESPTTALHREVFEETGWHIAQPRKVGVFRLFTFMPEYDLWAEKICHIYVARPTICHGPPTEPDHETLWSRPDVAAQLLKSPGDRHFAELFCTQSGRRF